MKRLFAILLALIMIMSLAITAFADETKGTIVNSTTRTYDAYQIFTGTQAEGNAVLGDIDWGNGVNSTAFLNELMTLSVGGGTPFATCTDAASVAAALKDQQDDSAIAKAFANLANKHKATVAATFAASETKTLNSGYYLLVDTSTTNPTQNPALLQVTNKSSLSITNKTPGVPTPEKKILEGDSKTPTDSTTAYIGDTITFELKATLPASFENYESYKLTFVDTLSKGFEFNTNSVVVKVNGTAVDCFTSTHVINNGTTTITINNDNILDDGIAADSIVTVTYTAVLNNSAIIGTAGNPNSFVLQYSNDPNNAQSFKETTPDEVQVFTFKIPVFKYTGSETSKTPLAGAVFSLYTIEAPNTAVTVSPDLDASNVYHVCTKGCQPLNHDHRTEIRTDATGKFTIKGLKPGTYKLVETVTPPGYNTCDPITVVINADGTLTQDGTATTEVGVLNNAGSTLPETGGMGTTLFYIIGGLMMVAAVVLLVTKKRMASAE